MKTIIFNIPFLNDTYKKGLDLIISKSAIGQSSYFCFANAHMVVESHKSHDFLIVLNNAEGVFMDGMPIVLVNKWFNNDSLSERIAGMDCVGDLIKITEKKSIPIFFYGSTEENLIKLKHHIDTYFPKLIVKGYFSPPFRPLTEREMEEHSEIINNSGAKIVFVSLGCPKQEIWMNKMHNKINCVMLGVGNAILTFAELEKRAPLWMQKSGLEWLFRFALEPKRLFKRYIIGNVHFLYLLVLEFKKRFFLKSVNTLP
jgi:N-acetylglucosaminyldiphosphoundecaprenol N-acetyl-beta-D-mannosaminyltransferase